jgi:hypothetical protein
MRQGHGAGIEVLEIAETKIHDDHAIWGGRLRVLAAAGPSPRT